MLDKYFNNLRLGIFELDCYFKIIDINKTAKTCFGEIRRGVQAERFLSRSDLLKLNELAHPGEKMVFLNFQTEEIRRSCAAFRTGSGNILLLFYPFTGFYFGETRFLDIKRIIYEKSSDIIELLENEYFRKVCVFPGLLNREIKEIVSFCDVAGRNVFPADKCIFMLCDKLKNLTYGKKLFFDIENPEITLTRIKYISFPCLAVCVSEIISLSTLFSKNSLIKINFTANDAALRLKVALKNMSVQSEEISIAIDTVSLILNLLCRLFSIERSGKTIEILCDFAYEEKRVPMLRQNARYLDVLRRFELLFNKIKNAVKK